MRVNARLEIAVSSRVSNRLRWSGRIIHASPLTSRLVTRRLPRRSDDDRVRHPGQVEPHPHFADTGRAHDDVAVRRQESVLLLERAGRIRAIPPLDRSEAERGGEERGRDAVVFDVAVNSAPRAAWM